MVVLADGPVGQTYRNHFVLQDADSRRPSSNQACLRHRTARLDSEAGRQNDRQKKCGPTIEGPHSLFTQTARAKEVLD
ncbi:hypothetical protein BG61_29460 [Caballeronia glathei]|uniref:Uncharacterized protein n=1 Tax=Caballeronia glathei TaxID=60547 RepID=A0A069PVP9_9BURK|nr:hypothetical protein BG61_29460 [Caballeronia glathei]